MDLKTKCLRLDSHFLMMKIQTKTLSDEMDQWSLVSKMGTLSTWTLELRVLNQINGKYKVELMTLFGTITLTVLNGKAASLLLENTMLALSLC